MKEEKIEDWELKKAKLLKEHPELTTDDLIYEIGKEEELLKKLEEKLKKNRQEIRKWLSLMG